ncbi:MAG: hypothetical protein KJ971_03255 [Firmicutes bacterium]|nr:hypothetical protein [Bacillota bacterium]
MKQPKINLFDSTSDTFELKTYYAITPVMYSDITGNAPEWLGYDISLIPTKQLNNFVVIDKSLVRTSSIFYPENRDDYTKAWSLVSGVIAANFMMSFYTAAGGLTFFGLSTLSSVLIGVAFWAITVVAIAVIIYVVVDSIASTNENGWE